MSWYVAIACDVQADDVGFAITGVNHLPWITELSVHGEDGFEVLRRALAERPEAKWFTDEHALKLALLERYGAMPGAGDRHVAEFFPWALTPAVGVGQVVGHPPHVDRGPGTRRGRLPTGAPQRGRRWQGCADVGIG